MAMKAEPRGKYAGLKLHLDENECKQVLDWYKSGAKAGAASIHGVAPFPTQFVMEIAENVSTMLMKSPDMLKARSQAQIVKALKRDYKKISEQLAQIDKGGDWKAVE
jgi:hypothetical protein